MREQTRRKLSGAFDSRPMIRIEQECVAKVAVHLIRATTNHDLIRGNQRGRVRESRAGREFR